MKIFLQSPFATSATMVMLVGCSGQGDRDKGALDERSAVEDTGFLSPDETGDTGIEDSGHTGLEAGTSDSSEEDTAETGEDSAESSCELPMSGYYTYTAISMEGACGTDTTILDLYGLTVGFRLDQTAIDSFQLDYDGFPLEPSCTLDQSCTFTCTREGDGASMTIMGIDAELRYEIETSGISTSSQSLEGSHAFTLSCDGSDEDCVKVADGIVGATLPCTGTLPWTATLEE